MSSSLDGALSGGSSVRRPGSEGGALAEIYMIYNLSLLTIMIELKLHSLNFIFIFYAVVFDF
jgi:hypothetical protein